MRVVSCRTREPGRRRVRRRSHHAPASTAAPGVRPAASTVGSASTGRSFQGTNVRADVWAASWCVRAEAVRRFCRAYRRTRRSTTCPRPRPGGVPEAGPADVFEDDAGSNRLVDRRGVRIAAGVPRVAGGIDVQSAGVTAGVLVGSANRRARPPIRPILPRGTRRSERTPRRAHPTRTIAPSRASSPADCPVQAIEAPARGVRSPRPPRSRTAFRRRVRNGAYGTRSGCPRHRPVRGRSMCSGRPMSRSPSTSRLWGLSAPRRVCVATHRCGVARVERGRARRGKRPARKRSR